jgi:hypothetical protein
VTMTVPKLPWFHGEVHEITVRLRAAVTPDRPDGDCVQAVMYIEAIAEQPGLSAARRARLTAAVVEAVQLVRGWVSEPIAGEPVPVDADPVPVPVVELVDEVPVAQLAVSGDVVSIVGHLDHAANARPDSECVVAIRLIEAIHERGLAAMETVRLTGAVLQAVRHVRGWAPDAPPGFDARPTPDAGLAVAR